MVAPEDHVVAALQRGDPISGNAVGCSPMEPRTRIWRSRLCAEITLRGLGVRVAAFLTDLMDSLAEPGLRGGAPPRMKIIVSPSIGPQLRKVDG